jgi:hypothetical protein
MKALMGTLLVAAMLLVFAPGAPAQVAIGIEIGAPPPPRVLHIRPVNPGPEFFWVDGYWYPVGRHYRWHEGYWTRPPYEGARWIGPRHEDGRYYTGYWDGDRGRFEHDHHWDRERDRDHRRYREDHDRDHDRR